MVNSILFQILTQISIQKIHKRTSVSTNDSRGILDFNGIRGSFCVVPTILMRDSRPFLDTFSRAYFRFVSSMSMAS